MSSFIEKIIASIRNFFKKIENNLDRREDEEFIDDSKSSMLTKVTPVTNSIIYVVIAFFVVGFIWASFSPFTAHQLDFWCIRGMKMTNRQMIRIGGGENKGDNPRQNAPSAIPNHPELQLEPCSSSSSGAFPQVAFCLV